ncbi:MAG TPA: tetratricopeptide repeat protein [Kofleriaceae bacterium]|nr:tetratricopeptide repeat protein [Kofleriaceae bacterium]
MLPLGAVLATLYAAAAVLGPRPAAALGATAFLAAGLVLVVVPRGAHRWFRRGAYLRAELAYRALRWLRLDRGVRGSLQVSIAACRLGRERHRDGLALLERIDPAALGESARAAWLNDRAYAVGRGGGDLGQALADIDQAIALRPDVPGFRHTRGVILLGLGRVDEALRELDAVWLRRPGDEAPGLFEAERCYDLGRAWLRKGEAEYAADYFDRARRAAPESRWAVRAAETMPAAGELPQALRELLA